MVVANVSLGFWCDNCLVLLLLFALPLMVISHESFLKLWDVKPTSKCEMKWNSYCFLCAPKGERATPAQNAGVCPSLGYKSITYSADVPFVFLEVCLFWATFSPDSYILTHFGFCKIISILHPAWLDSLRSGKTHTTWFKKVISILA